MQFNLLTLLGSAALVAANTVTFQSLDDVARTVYFTANAGLPPVEPVYVPAGSNVTVHIPFAWIGNFHPVSDGSENVTGIIGEVAFNGWNSLTYFDVSAIINALDHNGIQTIFPSLVQEPVSGCHVWPCNNAYYLPDDVQTKVTSETDLICTLGNNGVTSRRDVDDHHESPSYKHDFVLGK
ncbi:DNase1 protein [Colletotrichum orchidophilum]|uniref:DNase1 protein n=1 Tax=Colletotrichum orchidophilum TaxID=1209926 RepID=A0A1G4B4P4_9PEZI|nr:DNase1 protein [Colletotrichum orchidophilum]OHE96399.1 DNase1 protein [Colletotrichum orchidophilum]